MNSSSKLLTYTAMKNDIEQEELLPIPMKISTPVKPIEDNNCESRDARREFDVADDEKLSKEIIHLRFILLFLGDCFVLYTFFSWVDHFTVCRLTFSPSSGEPFHM